MKVLGAHMLEICPTIATGKAKLEVHPLGIAGRPIPRASCSAFRRVRRSSSLIDMGNRFRMTR